MYQANSNGKGIGPQRTVPPVKKPGGSSTAPDTSQSASSVKAPPMMP